MKNYSALAILLPLCVILYPSHGHLTPLDEKIAQSYNASDYVTTATLLEQQLKHFREKALKKEKFEYADLYRKYILLAHIYAWRLDRPEVALAQYQELNGLRQSLEEIERIPPFEILYIAEIYERQNNYSRVKEYYGVILKELAAWQGRERDESFENFNQELLQLVKYQIDGFNLKIQTAGYQLLLKKLNFSSQLTYKFFPFLGILFAPGVGGEFISGGQADLENSIRQSPPDLGSMIKNYLLLITASASSVDETSERALEAYLSKYPESYYSLSLRYLFSRFYKENGEIPKAERLDQQLVTIAQKRGMEILTGPDPRFASPEKTWETHRKALLEGDVNVVKECYVPGKGKHIPIFNLLGKEKMKEIGENLGPIVKVSVTRERAEYLMRTKGKDNREVNHPVYFHNLGGEWKMQNF